MSLEKEIEVARQKIVKDGFDMSIGEIIRIYERGELIINPAYQRLFRWDENKKTRFIESLFLGIPIPPIFVYTDETGRWELVDGLQRLSTIFQYAGMLRDADGQIVDRFVPSGTKMLPSLNGMAWEATDDEPALPLPIRLDIERARLRLEILKRESDPRAKYELFQRLNTGGAKLSEQEVRNCVAVMLNRPLYDKFSTLADYPSFRITTALTERAIEEQKPAELVLRFLAYRYKDYSPSIDIHEWLDDVLIDIAQDEAFDFAAEEDVFKRTFDLLNNALGDNVFRKCENGNFTRGFLISAFEAIAYGVSLNLARLEQQGLERVRESVMAMWADPRFYEYARAGVRGTTRLGKILPIASEWFRG